MPDQNTDSSNTGHANMQQTGIVNYTDLTSRSGSSALGAAQRVIKGDIDTSMIEALTKTFVTFQIPPQKEKMICAKVDSVRSVAFYNKPFLRFGLGITHNLTAIRDTTGGLVSIALCACLLANYDELYTVEVLAQLAMRQGLKLNEFPATPRWITLLETCAGIMGEDFNDLVSALSTILEPRTSAGVVPHLATPPKLLAEALHNLAKISNREEQVIVNATFTGGFDAAWLGAVAVFVLDLSLRIMQGDGGITVCVRNTKKKLGDGSFHVTILMGENENLRMTKTIMHLPRGNVLFEEDTSRAYRVTRFDNRSPSCTLMKVSFGDAARTLLEKEASKDFAKLLLYAVYRSSKLDDYQPYVRDRERYEWPNLNYGLGCQMGRDLWQSSAERFSELKPCMEEISYDLCSTITEEDARECVQGIIGLCHCSQCSKGNSEYCLIGVAGAIMRLVALLSIADLDEAVPTPFGLRQLYQRSCPLDGRYRWPSKWSGEVNELFELFCTRRSYELIRSSNESYLALASGGVCCFYDFLTDIRKQPGDLARVRIMRGRIQSQAPSRDFEKVERLDLRYLGHTEWTGLKCTNKRTFHMTVSETINSETLQVAYTTNLDSVDPGWPIQIESLMRWAGNSRQDVSIQCAPELYLSSTDPGIQEDEDDYPTVPGRHYKEYRWDIYTGTPKAPIDIISANPLVDCLATEDNEKFSLLLITWNPRSCNNLVVYKSSTRIWEDELTSIEHIYAEFGRRYWIPNDNVGYWEIVRVSDCVRCVLTFVSSIWPMMFGDKFLPEVITGSLLTYSAESTILEETHYKLVKREVIRESLASDSSRDRMGRLSPFCSNAPSDSVPTMSQITMEPSE